MDNIQKIPLTAAVGGVAALALRMWNLRAGFEESTGLPIPGDPSFPALLALLVAVLLALVAQSWRLSDGGNPRFPFRTQSRLLSILPVAGAALLCLSGAADILEALGGSRDPYEYAGLIGGEAVGMSTGVQLASGALTLLSAWAVFECARACLRGTLRGRAIVMIPAVSLAFRLVTVYRIDSVNPVLQDYAPALVALLFHVLGFYAFSAFTFDSGNLRQFAVAAGASVTLSLCVLADKSDYISTPLLLLGSAAALAGFLVLALQAPADNP
ncbi:MAG: hypothetical protein IJT31_01055 [Oscillibacter sp.]|nr:hypothetical protein [Oscillibacter sp.]